MFEREDRADWGRKRSLLAFGRPTSEDRAKPESVSLLSVALQLNPSWKDDAAARHRQARAQREAAAETTSATTVDAQEPLLMLAEQEDFLRAAEARENRAFLHGAPKTASASDPTLGKSFSEPPRGRAKEQGAPSEGLLAAMRRALTRKGPHQEEPGPQEIQPEPEPASAGPQPTEHPMYPVHPDPNAFFAPQHQPAFYPQQPPFQQAAYAPPFYPPQAPHHLQSMMPQQAQYPTQHPGQYPAPRMQPQFYAPAQPYPYGQQQMAYPQPYRAQMQPMPQPYPYPQPMPQGGQMAFASQQPQMPVGAPVPAMPVTASPDEPTTVEEIRASLREFRDAVRELTESRSRRRYF
jgi:hypothetical protein